MGKLLTFFLPAEQFLFSPHDTLLLFCSVVCTPALIPESHDKEAEALWTEEEKKNTAFECNIRNEHIFWKIKLSVHLCENREKSWMLWEKLLYWKYSFPQKGKNAFLHMNMHKPSNFVRIFSAFHNNFAKYHERLFKERFLPYLFLFHL